MAQNVPKTTGRALCACGPVRQVNQDAVFLYEGDRFALYAVADGMGGHADGEKASGAIVSALGAWTAEQDAKGETVLPRDSDSLYRRLGEENATVYYAYQREGLICGSTLVLLLCVQDRYELMTVGDSRVYHLQGFQAVQISTDDVWENDYARTLGLTPEEVRTHPDRGKLSRSFGTSEALSMHRRTGFLREKDVFLLCSDGIFKYCDTRDLSRAMRGAKGGAKKSERALERLEKTVLTKGTQDNYSAILVRTGADEGILPWI